MQMKLKFAPIGLLITITLLVNSCASNLYFTTLDVLKPAEVSFPLQVKSVIVLDNTAKQLRDMGHIDIDVHNRRTNVSVNATDSAAIFATTSLKDELKAISFFDKVDFSPINQNPNGYYNSSLSLTDKKVKSICSLYNVDAIIALNEILVIDTTQQIFTSEGPFYCYLDAKVKTKWGIYMPGLKATSVVFKDSFLWENSNYDLKDAIKGLPRREDAIVDACILTGSNSAQRMIPRWEKVDRFFFGSKDKTMTAAMDSIKYQKWEKSIELWKSLVEVTKSNTLKYKIYHNMAVTYEIMGNLDEAITYSQKSLQIYASNLVDTSKDGNLILFYNQDIRKRRNEVQLLQNQLGN